MLVLAGDWSAYWYNGHIYASEIARGLDVFELTPTKFLTQNEIDAARAVRVAELNVQNQQRIEWPQTLVVAKAYIDQLERSQALATEQVTALRQAIQKAESSKLNKKDKARLAKLAPSLEKTAVNSKSPADAKRLQALAEILKHPTT
jgi:ribosomal protein S13